MSSQGHDTSVHVWWRPICKPWLISAAARVAVVGLAVGYFRARDGCGVGWEECVGGILTCHPDLFWFPIQDSGRPHSGWTL